jgi:hypothetical protein
MDYYRCMYHVAFILFIIGIASGFHFLKSVHRHSIWTELDLRAVTNQYAIKFVPKAMPITMMYHNRKSYQCFTQLPSLLLKSRQTNSFQLSSSKSSVSTAGRGNINLAKIDFLVNLWKGISFPDLIPPKGQEFILRDYALTRQSIQSVLTHFQTCKDCAGEDAVLTCVAPASVIADFNVCPFAMDPDKAGILMSGVRYPVQGVHYAAGVPAARAVRELRAVRVVLREVRY